MPGQWKYPLLLRCAALNASTYFGHIYLFNRRVPLIPLSKLVSPRADTTYRVVLSLRALADAFVDGGRIMGA